MKGGEGSSKTVEKRATGGQQQTLEGAIARSTLYARNSKRCQGEADERNHVLCG